MIYTEEAVVLSNFLKLVSELKDRYGDHPLYSVPIGSQLYIFRPLSDGEYALLVGSGTTSEEDLCQAAVVWPEDVDWERAPAADAGHLAEFIRIVSGFGDPSVPIDMLGQFRAEMRQFRAQAEAMIAHAFPSKSLEEMEKWPIETLLKYLSRAEWILQTTRPDLEVAIDLAMPTNDKTPAELAQELREQGIDPMMALYKPPRRDANWIEIPFIHGVDGWRKVAAEEGELDAPVPTATDG